jgi:uncharacterized protein
MATVRFVDDIIGQETVLKAAMRELFKKGDTVAVKLHYGEPGNPTSLRPAYAKTVVSALKVVGCKPFLFDSTVMYGGARSAVETHRTAAAQQGFSEGSIGCPLVFSDDVVVVKTDHIEAEVAKPLADADAIVALTHVKGHPCSGFGAAIKNFGMGGVSKRTKTEIHRFAAPVYTKGCTGCKMCERICPAKGIKVEENTPEIGTCWGCDSCVINCPNKCFKIRVAPFDTLLSEAACAVISGRKVLYLNVLKDMTKFCDCLSDPGQIMLPDIGALISTDIVAIDKASHDLIVKAAGKDLFKEIHHKSAMLHINEAARLGMGTLSYTLVK